SAGSTWSIVNGSGSGIITNGGTGNAFNNAGTFQMTGGTANTVGGIFSNTGTVNANTGTLTFSGTYRQLTATAVTRVNGGQIGTTNTSGLSILAGTLLGVDPTGNKGIVGGVSIGGVSSAGTLHPGSSPGILSSTDFLVLGATSSFDVDINGTTP